jgi:hypothetical protein
MQEFRGHTSYVNDVAWSVDGSQVSFATREPAFTVGFRAVAFALDTSKQAVSHASTTDYRVCTCTRCLLPAGGQRLQ